MNMDKCGTVVSYKLIQFKICLVHVRILYMQHTFPLT